MAAFLISPMTVAAVVVSPPFLGALLPLDILPLAGGFVRINGCPTVADLSHSAKRFKTSHPVD